MKTNLKKIFAFLLVAVMMVSQMNLGAFAATTDTFDWEHPEPGHVHQWQEYEHQDPTCTESGYAYKYCVSYDGYYCPYVQWYEETLPALGHNWVATTGSATCTSGGLVTYVCSRCGEQKQERVNALGHDWSPWTSADATCTTAGSTSRYCRRCGLQEANSSQALGHDMGEWTRTADPTCVEDGEEVSTCNRCGYQEKKVLPALGHDMGGWDITTMPSTDQPMILSNICQRCGYTETMEVPYALDLQIVSVSYPGPFHYGNFVEILWLCKNVSDSAVQVSGVCYQNADGMLPTSDTVEMDMGECINVVPGGSVLITTNITVSADDMAHGSLYRSMYVPARALMANGDVLDSVILSNKVEIDLPVESTNISLNNPAPNNVAINPNLLVYKTAVEETARDSYGLGDTVYMKIVVTNPNDFALSDIMFRDPNAQPDQLWFDLKASGKTIITVAHVIDEMDVARGFYANTAYISCLGTAIISNEFRVPVHDGPGMDNGYIDLTIIDNGQLEAQPAEKLTITKKVVNMPANGLFFTEGETIKYEIVVENNTSKTFQNLEIYEYWADKDPIGTVEESLPGGRYVFEFSVMVDAHFCDEGVVENIASCEYVDSGREKVVGSDWVFSKCGWPENSEDQHTATGTTSTITGTDITDIPGTQIEFPYIVKEVISAVPNGMFYMEGDTIKYHIFLYNNGNELTDINVYDPLYKNGKEPLFTAASVAPHETQDLYFDYVVTQADADAGFVSNYAYMKYSINSDDYVYYSNTVTVTTGAIYDDIEDPGTPLRALATTKKTTSTPANGSYYVEGETITYEITVTNIGAERLIGVYVLDGDADLGMVTIGVHDTIMPGETFTHTYSHVVTKANVKDGFVINGAMSLAWDEYANKVVSPSVSVIDKCSDKDIKNIGGKDPFKIYDGTSMETNGGGHCGEPLIPWYPEIPILTMNGGCKRTLILYEDGGFQMTVDNCEYHTKVDKAANGMIVTGSEEEWKSVKELWQTELEKLYDIMIIKAPTPESMMTAYTEKELFFDQLDAYENELKLVYADHPEVVEELIATELKNKVTDTCWLMCNVPGELVLPIYEGKSEGSEVDECRFNVLEAEDGHVRYQLDICSDHGIPSLLTENLLYVEAGRIHRYNNWDRVRGIWMTEYQQNMRERFENAAGDKEQYDALNIQNMRFTRWIESYEAVIRMLYPNSASADKAIALILMERTLEVCGCDTEHVWLSKPDHMDGLFKNPNKKIIEEENVKPEHEESSREEVERADAPDMTAPEKSGVNAGLIAGIAGGVVVLGGGGAAAGIILGKKKKKEDEQ